MSEEKKVEKVLIPYSKANVDKKPLPVSVSIPLGPFVFEMMLQVIDEVNEQGWTAKFLTFAGMLEIKSTNLMIPKQVQPQVVPVFYAAIYKIFNEGEEYISPTFTMPTGKKL